MTDEGRRKRIQEALQTWHGSPEPKESLPLFWRGQQQLFPVVVVDLDVPLLNANSHRLRAQLESDPRGAGVQAQPWTDESQTVVAELLRKPDTEFEHLKENLTREGQRHPGVITRKGVMYNANRRLVALRDLHNVEKRWIRVAVLPEDAEPKELAELELRLQVQEELKAPYSLTNELLFIEELARSYGMGTEQIAITLRWMTKKGQPDATEVEQRRRILVLIREIQRLADPHVPLTYFDGKLEQLKALEQKYNVMTQDDPAEARRFLTRWLLVALAGLSSVHQLRSVFDENFDEEYLIPRLNEQETLRVHATTSSHPNEGSSGGSLPGVDALAPEDADRAAAADTTIDLRPLINALTSRAAMVPMPDGNTLDRDSIEQAIRQAARGAYDDWRADDRAEERLDEPIAQLREAVRHLRRAIGSYSELKGTEEFEQTRRGSFNYLCRQLRKLTKQLEAIESVKESAKTTS